MSDQEKLLNHIFEFGRLHEAVGRYKSSTNDTTPLNTSERGELEASLISELKIIEDLINKLSLPGE